MATKNLARTVIEGGRARYNKFDRRYSNRQERQRARDFTHRLLLDSDLAESGDVPRRPKVWRHHRDRLAAAERWLASFIGTEWDEVRSQIAARFDTRTIAGQHIVFDHLLPSVKTGPCTRYCYYDFCVDEKGILQRHARTRWVSSRRLPPGKIRRSWSEIQCWAEGRRVGLRGTLHFWFEPTSSFWVACSDSHCWRQHEGIGSERCHRDPRGRFRQTKLLSSEELEFWKELTEDKQELLRLPAKEMAKAMPSYHGRLRD